MHNCGIRQEDGYTAGLRESVLLSSSCCSAFTLTAGAYVTLGPHHFFSPSVALPSLPSANLSIGVDVLQRTILTLLTPSRPTVTQMSVY